MLNTNSGFLTHIIKPLKNMTQFLPLDSLLSHNPSFFLQYPNLPSYLFALYRFFSNPILMPRYFLQPQPKGSMWHLFKYRRFASIRLAVRKFPRAVYDHVDKATGVKSDQTIALVGPRTSLEYPDCLRRISYFDSENKNAWSF